MAHDVPDPFDPNPPVPDEVVAGLYLRISLDWKGDAAGVERQNDDGTGLIKKRGWRHGKTYTDNDISAAGRKRRPEYQQMLTDLESGKINAIVARSLERLFKTRREQLQFMELGQRKRFLVAFTHGMDVDFSNAAGRAVADMQAAWARMEMEQKSERHKSEVAQAAKKGLPHVGRRAFGFTADGLHLELDEAPHVAEAYRLWLAAEGMGPIARRFNAAGILTPRGNQWTAHSIRELLANPRNAGLRGTRDVVDEQTGRRAQWHRIIGPAVWPGIVSEATWRAAMKRIHDPDRPGAHVGGNRAKYLLPGLALCGADVGDGVECRRPMLTTTRSGYGHALRCMVKGHIARRADYIEDWVVEMLMDKVRNDALPKLRRADGDVDVDALRTESMTLRARLNDIAVDRAEGVLDREQARTAGNRVRSKLADLDRQIAAAGKVDPVAVLLDADDPEEVWDDPDFLLASKRAIIDSVMQVVVLRVGSGRPGGVRFRGDSIRIEWRAERG